MWTSFAYDLDPNGHGGGFPSCLSEVELLGLTCCVVPSVVNWPRYGNSTSNFVFRSDQSYVEPDVDRLEGVAYINTIVR